MAIKVVENSVRWVWSYRKRPAVLWFTAIVTRRLLLAWSPPSMCWPGCPVTSSDRLIPGAAVWRDRLVTKPRTMIFRWQSASVFCFPPCASIPTTALSYRVSRADSRSFMGLAALVVTRCNGSRTLLAIRPKKESRNCDQWHMKDNKI